MLQIEELPNDLPYQIVDKLTEEELFKFSIVCKKYKLLVDEYKNYKSLIKNEMKMKTYFFKHKVLPSKVLSTYDELKQLFIEKKRFAGTILLQRALRDKQSEEFILNLPYLLGQATVTYPATYLIHHRIELTSWLLDVLPIILDDLQLGLADVDCLLIQIISLMDQMIFFLEEKHFPSTLQLWAIAAMYLVIKNEKQIDITFQTLIEYYPSLTVELLQKAINSIINLNGLSKQINSLLDAVLNVKFAYEPSLLTAIDQVARNTGGIAVESIQQAKTCAFNYSLLLNTAVYSTHSLAAKFLLIKERETVDNLIPYLGEYELINAINSLNDLPAELQAYLQRSYLEQINFVNQFGKRICELGSFNNPKL